MHQSPRAARHRSRGALLFPPSICTKTPRNMISKRRRDLCTALRISAIKARLATRQIRHQSGDRAPQRITPHRKRSRTKPRSETAALHEHRAIHRCNEIHGPTQQQQRAIKLFGGWIAQPRKALPSKGLTRRRRNNNRRAHLTQLITSDRQLPPAPLTRIITREQIQANAPPTQPQKGFAPPPNTTKQIHQNARIHIHTSTPRYLK